MNLRKGVRSKETLCVFTMVITSMDSNSSGVNIPYTPVTLSS